jgi:hypothetical protein
MGAMREPEQEIADDRPQVFVHCEALSDDPVRVFYEIPDRIAELVREAAVIDGETFASCLLNITLEREGALGEVRRLSTALKEMTRKRRRADGA